MSERFVVKDEIVTDAKSGLQWEADHHGPMSWNEAQKYAESLRLGGHEDWRVPTLEELVTLIDYSKYRPASTFPGMPNDYFWLSSSYAGSASNAWAVHFSYGSVSYSGKTATYYVRCVRRGPTDPSGLSEVQS